MQQELLLLDRSSDSSPFKDALLYQLEVGNLMPGSFEEKIKNPTLLIMDSQWENAMKLLAEEDYDKDEHSAVKVITPSFCTTCGIWMVIRNSDVRCCACRTPTIFTSPDVVRLCVQVCVFCPFILFSFYFFLKDIALSFLLIFLSSLQVLDEELLKDTDIVYLQPYIGSPLFVPAMTGGNSITARVHDGRNSLYVTFEIHTLLASNFRLPLPTEPNGNQDKRHPLVGAELLITIPVSDIYGCFCCDVELQYNRRISLALHVLTSEHNTSNCCHAFCLRPRHVEFVQFSPLPACIFRDLIAPRRNFGIAPLGCQSLGPQLVQ
jgi:hypothetical protein